MPGSSPIPSHISNTTTSSTSSSAASSSSPLATPSATPNARNTTQPPRSSSSAAASSSSSSSSSATEIINQLLSQINPTSRAPISTITRDQLLTLQTELGTVRDEASTLRAELTRARTQTNPQPHIHPASAAEQVSWRSRRSRSADVRGAAEEGEEANVQQQQHLRTQLRDALSALRTAEARANRRETDFLLARAEADTRREQNDALLAEVRTLEAEVEAGRLRRGSVENIGAAATTAAASDGAARASRAEQNGGDGEEDEEQQQGEDEQCGEEEAAETARAGRAEERQRERRRRGHSLPLATLAPLYDTLRRHIAELTDPRRMKREHERVQLRGRFRALGDVRIDISSTTTTTTEPHRIGNSNSGNTSSGSHSGGGGSGGEAGGREGREGLLTTPLLHAVVNFYTRQALATLLRRSQSHHRSSSRSSNSGGGAGEIAAMSVEAIEGLAQGVWDAADALERASGVDQRAARERLREMFPGLRFSS